MAHEPRDSADLLRRALGAIEGLQSRVDRLCHEPIAILGMACRFPLADDPTALWLNLVNGVDAVREVPPDRSYLARNVPQAARWGGFLNQLDEFDAAFFGISPREAEKLDPQQRLLLEVSWEAFEDALLPVDSLFGSRTGVFTGIATFDYAVRLFGEKSLVDRHAATGALLSPAAGRLSYVFGFEGPCLAIDTACSSSLVALHVAVESLRAGDSDAALVAGVNRLLEPDLARNFAEAGMLSAHGRCRTFDADADGFVRAEGCGAIVLKRLSDALQAGDRIRAVIRGSAVNQDGRSGGLTAPNGPAQEAVLRRALANARLAPHEVAYVEAHGTGTRLGDPIEMRALGSVYGENRPSAQPLLIGALKSSVGHMEAASGIGGLIKAVLAMEHGVIPGNLHFRQPSPEIPWDKLPVRVPAAPAPWPAGTIRRAGISAFGFAGTNVHTILEQAPVPSASTGAPRQEHLAALSAKDAAALASLARAYAALLRDPSGPALEDFCHSANTGRSQLPLRSAVVGKSRDEIADGLDQIGRAGQVLGSASAELIALAQRWVGGAPLDWLAVDREPRRSVSLPFYPWQRVHGWIPPGRSTPAARESGHVVLGMELPLPASDQRRWHKRFQPDELDILAGHRIHGRARMPASGFLDLLLGAAAECASGWLAVEQFEIVAPLEPDDQPFELQVVATPREHQTWAAEVYGRSNGDAEWVLHARGMLSTSPQPAGTLSANLEFAVNGASYYEAAASRGLDFGPSLRLLRSLALTGKEGAGEIASPDPARFQPGIWDACLQIADAILCRQSPEELLVPVRIGTVRLRHLRRHDQRLTAEVGCSKAADGAEVWCRVFDQSGQLLAELDRVELRRFRQDPAIDAWFHTVTWEPWHFNPWKDEDREIERFCAAAEPLERLSRAYGARLLNGNLDVQPRYARLRAVLGAGLAASDGDADPAVLAADLSAHFPEARHELALLSQCAASLPAVLRGEQDPLAVLFPDGDTSLTAAVYSESPGARLMNRAVAEVARDWAQSRGGRVRAIEIGAGSGATAREVLHACAGYIQEYLFTDVSPAFAARARGLDGHGATLSFQTLDIEREPSPGMGQFDLVIAVNVLHATRDLGASLRHLSQVASPGALVLIVEPVERRTWVDLTFGLTEGWWRFEDRDLRGDYPLLDRARWLDLLARSGFHRLSALSPADDGFHLLLPQVLFTAHQASSAPSEWEFIDASEAAIDRSSAPADLLRMFRTAGDPLLTALKEGQKKRLCVVTRGALPADGSPRLESLPQSILAGLATVARLELPSLDLRHIDLDPDAPRPNLEPDSPGSAGEPVVAYRNGRRLVPRLTRAQTAQRASLPIRQDATYLVAGGTSGLGLLAAQWLTRRGASQVLITGRRDMPAADLAAFPQIRFVPGDVTDPAHWDGLRREFPSIAGVVLAAGVLDDGVIPHLDWTRFEHVLAPKTLGAWNLFRTLRKPLDWVVLYSSAVSVLGNPGQANHAAANSFLDAFVHILRSAGTPAVAINWGPVAGAAQGPGRAASLRGVGIEPLPKERVFDVLDRISIEGPAQIGVFQADWDSTEGRAPLLRNLRASPAAPIPARSALPPLEHLDCEDRKSAVRHYLRAEIAAVLGMEGPESVDERRGFFDLGMDSLGALELRGRLEKAFAIAVPATFVFRFPTVPKLAQWLLDALGFPASPLEQSAFASAAASESSYGAEQLTNLIETELNLWERREIHN